MSNCYSNVCGGVGNQLFQIATAYSYSKKYGKNLIIDYSKWNASQGRNPLEYQDTIFKNFQYGISPTHIPKISEKGFEFSPLSYIEGDIILDGYFQSWNYFLKYLDNFIRELQLPSVRTDFIKEKNVAFHIRRGDYLKFPHIFDIGNSYWKRQFVAFEDYQINVFSDSPEIILEEFDDYNFNMIQTSSEINDLTLISQHDNVVCSNSSFSWWASLLGKDKEKIIVPDKWLKNENCSDIYRSDFIVEPT